MAGCDRSGVSAVHPVLLGSLFTDAFVPFCPHLGDSADGEVRRYLRRALSGSEERVYCVVGEGEIESSCLAGVPYIELPVIVSEVAWSSIEHEKRRGGRKRIPVYIDFRTSPEIWGRVAEVEFSPQKEGNEYTFVETNRGSRLVFVSYRGWRAWGITYLEVDTETPNEILRHFPICGRVLAGPLFSVSLRQYELRHNKTEIGYVYVAVALPQTPPPSVVDVIGVLGAWNEQSRTAGW